MMRVDVMQNSLTIYVGGVKTRREGNICMEDVLNKIMERFSAVQAKLRHNTSLN